MSFERWAHIDAHFPCAYTVVSEGLVPVDVGVCCSARSNIELHAVLCAQVADEEYSQSYDKFLQKPGLLQMFTVRNPTAQAVAHYYFQNNLDPFSCPTVSVAKNEFSSYVRYNRWFNFGSAWNRNTMHHNASFNTYASRYAALLAQQASECLRVARTARSRPVLLPPARVPPRFMPLGPPQNAHSRRVRRTR